MQCLSHYVLKWFVTSHYYGHSTGNWYTSPLTPPPPRGVFSHSSTISLPHVSPPPLVPGLLLEEVVETKVFGDFPMWVWSLTPSVLSFVTFYKRFAFESSVSSSV